MSKVKAKSSYKPKCPIETGAYTSPVSLVLSKWESLTNSGQDFNPSQVSPQRKLFFILPTFQQGSAPFAKSKIPGLFQVIQVC